MASRRPARSSVVSFFSLFVAIAAGGPFACASDDATTFGKPGLGSAGTNNETGKAGGGTETGCGDLVACCLSLDDAGRTTCQDLATAFAGQENGDKNCVVALGGYRKRGDCDGTPIGAGGSDDPGDGGMGGSDPVGSKGGTGGGASKGGTGGAGGGTSKGGSGGTSGTGGGTSKGGSGGTGGTGGGTSKGGSGGTTSKGGGSGTGGSGGAGGSGTATSEAAACEQWAMAFCSRFATCGKGALVASYEDQADCVQREASDVCPLKFFGKSTWTPAGVVACASEFGGLSCEDLAIGARPSACEAPPGLVNAKGDCLADGDCASRSCSNGLAYFFSTPLFTTGSCAEVIEDGEPCAPKGEPPCRSYRCDSITKTCFGRAEQPAKCSSENVCGDGFRCVPSTGACVPYKAAGASCTKDECSSFLGLTCGTTGTCVAASHPGPGDQCDLLATCNEGSYCQTNFLTGTCVGQIEQGKACSSNSGSPIPSLQSSCRYPLICTGTDGSSTCQPPKI